MENPFLFQFRAPCQSPERVTPDPGYRYDPFLDMVIDMAADAPIPAIHSQRFPGPPTKKKDIEKGEDQKDRRMWQLPGSR